MTKKEFGELFTKLMNFSNEELCEIYYNLNGFEWDDRIGEKPKGFDDLPKIRRRNHHKFTIKATKRDYTHPVFLIVKEILPEKDYRYWLNVKKLKTMTPEQFERHWRLQLQRKITTF